jgi:hypothetical protein
MALSQHIAAVAFNERERVTQALNKATSSRAPANASARKGARGVGRKQGRGVPLFTSNRVRLGQDGSASAQRQARSRREDRGGGK